MLSTPMDMLRVINKDKYTTPHLEHRVGSVLLGS